MLVVNGTIWSREPITTVSRKWAGLRLDLKEEKRGPKGPLRKRGPKGPARGAEGGQGVSPFPDCKLRFTTLTFYVYLARMIVPVFGSSI